LFPDVNHQILIYIHAGVAFDETGKYTNSTICTSIQALHLRAIQNMSSSTKQRALYSSGMLITVDPTEYRFVSILLKYCIYD
jgi:hypothetical protein